MGSTDAQDVEILLTLSKQAVASVNEYKATQKIDDRLQALEQVRKLARALEQPGDTVYQLALSPTILMAVKIAHDLDVFRVLSATTSFVTCEQLAAPKHSDVLLIERIMRVLVCNGFANERGPGKYGPTQLSRQMTMRTSIGTVECLFMDFLPVYHKTPKFLQETGYKNPADPLHGPFQYAHQTSLSCWDWLARNPGAMDRFNTFMEGSRANAPHWAEYFPVQERLLDGVDLTNRPLLVDVGGGRGHDLLGFKYRFPCHPGKLILEELPSVINDIKTLDRGINPGARAYYLKHIMHDWSDENCRTILKQIVAVMERGFSKVLIEDHILPDMNVGPRQTLLDMTVMAWCPGAERSRRRWTKLLSSVGLVIKDFWLPDGDREGVIEAELQDTPPESPGAQGARGSADVEQSAVF
ncbi:S-adenosyl-L-methionine-dependent methyltransferase [Aspergillus aurantiobrunneus]